MTNTRQEERLEELEKNQEVLSTKLDRLYSKFDEMQETLKQLLALKQGTATQSCTQDISTNVTVTTKATEQNHPVRIHHVSTLCIVKKVEMPDSVGEFLLSTVAEVQQDWSLRKIHYLTTAYTHCKPNDQKDIKGEVVLLKQQFHNKKDSIFPTSSNYGGMEKDLRVHIFLSFWKGVRWKMRRIELSKFHGRFLIPALRTRLFSGGRQ